MADANKRIIQRLFEESWTGNFDAIDEFVSADYVGHDPSEQEPTRGPDGLKEFIARYRSAFEGVRLIVEDSGSGIPPDHLPRIFDRFYKVDFSRTVTPVPSGSGLGLSIVQAIVARHGGTISASNAEGGGARFEIVLPA